MRVVVVLIVPLEFALNGLMGGGGRVSLFVIRGAARRGWCVRSRLMMES